MVSVQEVIEDEEVAFNRTLIGGLKYFDKVKARLAAAGSTVVPGADVSAGGGSTLWGCGAVCRLPLLVGAVICSCAAYSRWGDVWRSFVCLGCGCCVLLCDLPYLLCA